MTIKMPHSVKLADPERRADAFISGAFVEVPKPPVADEHAGKTVVNMRFDTALLARIDAAAKKQGISRTAWLHVAAAKAIE
jgi:hypothetical protein